MSERQAEDSLTSHETDTIAKCVCPLSIFRSPAFRTVVRLETIVSGGLSRQRAKGRVILMFSPGEENGAAAAADCPIFSEIKPDLVISLHNFPVTRFGHAACPACCPR